MAAAMEDIPPIFRIGVDTTIGTATIIIGVATDIFRTMAASGVTPFILVSLIQITSTVRLMKIQSRFFTRPALLPSGHQSHPNKCLAYETLLLRN